MSPMVIPDAKFVSFVPTQPFYKGAYGFIPSYKSIDECARYARNQSNQQRTYKWIFISLYNKCHV